MATQSEKITAILQQKPSDDSLVMARVRVDVKLEVRSKKGVSASAFDNCKQQVSDELAGLGQALCKATDEAIADVQMIVKRGGGGRAALKEAEKRLEGLHEQWKRGIGDIRKNLEKSLNKWLKNQIKREPALKEAKAAVFVQSSYRRPKFSRETVAAVMNCGLDVAQWLQTADEILAFGDVMYDLCRQEMQLRRLWFGAMLRVYRKRLTHRPRLAHLEEREQNAELFNRVKVLDHKLVVARGKYRDQMVYSEKLANKLRRKIIVLKDYLKRSQALSRAQQLRGELSRVRMRCLKMREAFSQRESWSDETIRLEGETSMNLPEDIYQQHLKHIRNLSSLGTHARSLKAAMGRIIQLLDQFTA